MSEEELAAIEARQERAREGVFLLQEEKHVIRVDVPALVAEVRRLSAIVDPMLGRPYILQLCRFCLHNRTVEHRADCPARPEAS